MTPADEMVVFSLSIHYHYIDNSSKPNINMELTGRPFRGLPLYPLTPGPDHTPHSYQDQTEPSVRDNNEARTGGSRAPSDQISGSQIQMRRGVKRKRQPSGRSESRERKRRRLDHRSGSDSDHDQTERSVKDNNETRAGGSRTSVDQSSDSQIRMRRGVKRKRQTSSRSESRERKTIRLDHCSDSNSLLDSVSSGFSSGRSESRESKSKRLDHQSGSDSYHDQSEPSVRNDNEARAGRYRTSVEQSSDSQIEIKQGVKIKRQTCDRSESKEWKRRRSDHRSPERPLRELPLYSLTPGLDHTPLLSILACNTDYCSMTLDVSGEALEIAFYPTYNNSPSETSLSKSSTDDEQTGPSYPDSNSEDSPWGSRTSTDQSSGSQVKKRQGVKRKRNTFDRSESRERKSKRLDHRSGSDSYQDQTEPSVRDDNEARAGGTITSADQSSDSPIETRQGVKRKRQTCDRSESKKWKRRRSDHRSPERPLRELPLYSLTPGLDHTPTQIETRQGLKTKRKTSDIKGSRERKRKRLDHRSGSDSNLNSSSNSLSLGFSSGSLRETSRDDKQNSEVRASDDQISQNNFRRSSRSFSSKQGSGSQVEMKQGLKTKRRASSRSQNRKSTKNRLDHHSDSHLNDDQSHPSVRDNSKFRAGKSRAPSDQSSDSQVGMRQGLKTTRKDSSRSQTRKHTKNRLDHCSNLNDDQSDLSVRDSNEARSGGSRAPSDQSSVSQDETRQSVKTKRKESSRSQTRKSTKNRLDHHYDSHSNDDQSDPSVRDNNEARSGVSRASSDQSSDTQIEMKRGLKTKRKESSRSQTRKSTKNRLDHHYDSHSNDDQSEPSHSENNEDRKPSDQTSLDESRQRVKKSISELPDAQSKRRKSDHQSDSPIDSLIEQFSHMYISTPPAACGKMPMRPEPSQRENSQTRASGHQISQDESRQGVKRKRKISELPNAQSKRRKSDHQSDSSIDSLIKEFSRMNISTPPAACGKMPMRPELSHRENSKVRASGDQIRQDKSRQRVKRKISELRDTQSERTRSDHQSDSSIDSLIEELYVY